LYWVNKELLPWTSSNELSIAAKKSRGIPGEGMPRQRLTKQALSGPSLKVWIPQNFQQRSDVLIDYGIKHPERLLNEAFVKEIAFNVPFDQGIEIVLTPTQGAGDVIDVNGANQWMCDGKFFLHGLRFQKSKIRAGQRIDRTAWR
jgi:hypothetical protein